MRNVECGMRNVECGMRNAECGMRNAERGMRNLRWLVVLVLLVGLGLSLWGCGGTGTTPTATSWSLTVVVAGAEHSFSLRDLEALPAVEIRYTSKETGQENGYQGVRLRDLLAAAGSDLDSVAVVEVEAEDGFLAAYPRELALRDTSVLVYRMDGAPLPDSMGRVRMLSPGESTKFQVRFVRRITVKDGR